MVYLRARNGFGGEVAMVAGIGAVGAVVPQELDRLQAVFDLNVGVVVEDVGQIAGYGEARQFRAVARVVVGTPGRLDAVEVVRVEHGAYERMSAVDAGVEEAHVGSFRIAVERGAFEEVIEPFRLLLEREGVEEVRSLLGAAEFGDAVEGRDGLLDGGKGRAGDEDRTFREDELAG